MTFLGSFRLLQRVRALELRNGLLSMTGWDWVKRGLFTAVGVGLLIGLYVGFARALRYIETVQLIGPLLTWKLTAMALLTTFWMVVISNLIAAVSTLYFARDLPFLLAMPVSPRAVFVEKAVEASVYASWMVGLALVPYILALAKVKALGAGFVAACFGLSLPFLALAAGIGIFVTMLLMHLFPTSRTRDAVWILSSASLAAVYVVIRFAEPERLIRPDALEAVAEYLQYLQAPTAQYFPSWWMTEALVALEARNAPLFLGHAAKLALGGAAAYAFMTWLADPMYLVGVSGAQEGARRNRAVSLSPYPEERLSAFLGLRSRVPFLYWKDRKLVTRDVKHWSQLMLILALVIVYLFSVNRLPLDTPNLKSLVSFLNIGAAGFVLAALALRFAFPAVSLEGRSYWVVRAAPVTTGSILFEKLLLCAFPMMFLGGLVIAVTNHLLQADRFIALLSFGSILVVTWTLCAMGVAFGAIFPRFNVENIHQIESSAGGFAFMACALGYIGATIAIEAWIVQNHFWIKFGKAAAWDVPLVAYSAAALAALNVVAIAVPWVVGVYVLDNHEGD